MAKACSRRPREDARRGTGLALYVDGNLSCQNGPLGQMRYPATWRAFDSGGSHLRSGFPCGTLCPWTPHTSHPASINSVENNKHFIPNYGERYRHGERISTGFVESAVNQVISKRFCKKQLMAWTPRGAHLLLQIRTRVLNGDWEATFREWYPGFRAAPQPMAA